MDRSVIVTGGAQGIGAAYARALAAEGARVTVCDILSPDATVAAIRELGGNATGQVCDITDSEAVARLVEHSVAQFGGVSGLVNNAALFATLRPRPFSEIGSEEFDRVLRVNVRGTFECIKAVLPVMRAKGYGKIVNIASGTVFKGTPMMMPYVSSKGAIIAMTRAAARELGGCGIRVNCLAPGLTLSDGLVGNEDYPEEMTRSVLETRCLMRDQTPEDLTGALAFLLSSESDFMTGQTVVVDGGSVMH
ncbi:SDR family NAD(P)-dependent oxidoreductase [Muricoccus aerilatus]|uniref:SDR family NAD(P)-dependent oxidoreductase n=1 Tax=Muricoccus aerilatus TaxID=452982 RepID=UPI001B802121|nr:SDR family oxidoreductase [Roseomonas aerilata]